MRTSSPLIGALLFVGGIGGCFVLWGGHGLVVVFPVPLLALILACLGSAVLAFGGRDVWHTLRAFRVFFVAPRPESLPARSAEIASYLVGSLYAVGAVLFLLSLFGIMAAVHGPAELLGKNVATSICSLIYPIALSEGLLRPLQCRLRGRAHVR